MIKILKCFLWGTHSIIYRNNGDLCVLGLGYNIDGNVTLLMNDPSIIKINNQSISFEWSVINHKYFSDIFQTEISTLYKCLKRIQFSYGLKIPKFVIFEIIKFVN